jgi:putative PIN family toxin of toxin-antitoxin system
VVRLAPQRGAILTSVAIIDELRIVLQRPKFDRYAPLDDRMLFLISFIRDSTLVAITEQVQVCRDPKDDKFLELAVSGSATHIVTGDQDLLVLHPFRGVAIVTPGEFLDLVR